MKTEVSIVLKLCWGLYFVLASLYCFLSFIPYTYLFVIVNPPYAWLETFRHYNLNFLWMAVFASVLIRYFLRSRPIVDLVSFGEIGLALTISVFNPIAYIQNNRIALVWSAVFLLPLLAEGARDVVRHLADTAQKDPYRSIAYSNAALIGFLAGLISIAAPRLYDEANSVFLTIQRFDVEMMFWVIVEHVTVAIAIASIINLIRIFLSRFTKNSFLLGPGVVGFVATFCLTLGCLSFLEDSFGFRGWAAWAYSALFACSLILLSVSLIARGRGTEKSTGVTRWLPSIAGMSLIVLAIYGSLKIDRADDWNGIVHQSFALLIWVVLAISVCRLRRSQVQYSLPVILVAAAATCIVYEGLNYSKPVWAVDVGADRAQIHNGITNYSAQNVSFGLVDKILGNQPAAPCDAACRTLRQYSNIPNAKISRELKLVDDLSPSNAQKPNIFIFVIDSLRPDYLSVYNPRIDFTPNIESFGRESIVMRRAYADYAGTSLSEPSIWAGTLLLHAHYAQPFEKVNSLEKLARVDGYQMVISYDEILRQIIAPDSDITKLDMDKKLWGAVELSSTVEQLESVLDHRSPQDKPVFFYTQSMNVHVNASNDLPKRTSQNWHSRPGLDDRIAYGLHQLDGFFGGFINYLKSKNLYDNSIIVLTADHGDATGELGRIGHSSIIYPEVMRIPMIVHLPKSMQHKYVYDQNRLAELIDIAPSLYYLLGHRPIKTSLLTGYPMFLQNDEELRSYSRKELFFASDSHAAYGLLTEDGRYLYATYDSPSNSMLFDLQHDPTAQQSVLTPELKKQYDERILHYLETLSDFYGYHPTGG